MKARLTLITLACENIKKTGAFYQSFGFNETEFTKPLEHMFFFPMENGVILCLYDKANLGKDMGGYKLQGHSSTIALNATSGEEQDAMLEAWQKAGGTIIKEPHDTPWGGRCAYVQDPEGHPWEITWLKEIPLDERGNIPLG